MKQPYINKIVSIKMIMEDNPNSAPKKVLKECPWGIEEEKLLAKWADKSACYRWLHDQAEQKYSRLNMLLTIPVIVLSTLTGTANFGLGSTVPPSFQTVAQLGIGGVSLFTGIISTVANYLRYAQRMEAHRGAAVSWGKLYRKISVELSLGRLQRDPCMEFLLVSRSEMDRLIEQSPMIPDDILAEFKKSFTKEQVELTDTVKWNDMTKTEARVPTPEEKTARLVEDAAFAFKKTPLNNTFKQKLFGSPAKTPESPKEETEVAVDVPALEG